MTSHAKEVFDMVVSLTPEPPAHMAIFDNYQRIYANPYILYKYGYLKEAPRLLGVSWWPLGQVLEALSFNGLRGPKKDITGSKLQKILFRFVAKGGHQKHKDLIIFNPSFSQNFSQIFF